MDSKPRAGPRKSDGGAMARTEELRSPLWLMLPSVTWPHPDGHDLAETAGPLPAPVLWPLWQQCRILVWQHVMPPWLALNDCAVSGAREANAKIAARQTAMRPRAERRWRFTSSIPCLRSISSPRLSIRSRRYDDRAKNATRSSRSSCRPMNAVGSPTSRIAWKCATRASWKLWRVSSSVSPTATHPDTSGE